MSKKTHLERGGRDHNLIKSKFIAKKYNTNFQYPIFPFVGRRLTNNQKYVDLILLHL